MYFESACVPMTEIVVCNLTAKDSPQMQGSVILKVLTQCRRLLRGSVGGKKSAESQKSGPDSTMEHSSACNYGMRRCCRRNQYDVDASSKHHDDPCVSL